MIKNILSVLVFLFSIFFLYFVVNIYFSDNQQTKINKNRKTILKKIINNTKGLPILLNDTNKVIEFNSDFNNENKKKERNFWRLFDKWLEKLPLLVFLEFL